MEESAHKSSFQLRGGSYIITCKASYDINGKSPHIRIDFVDLCGSYITICFANCDIKKRAS